MLRHILGFLAIILIVYFVYWKRFVIYEFTLVFFLDVSLLMYHAKLLQNEFVPFCFMAALSNTLYIFLQEIRTYLKTHIA